ncbi:MAG: hypothetical protein BWK73_20220 [Thiothrix lacustris]|uniref:Uncharacterized protein n=1 Tax=Thiothrix lacustris TaxID=525917 RepID=A0A1Y1QPS4_9GAMM|nr:MAG: hypothetical protein BWK73_20220 [Thiothrix lacustris]
MVESKIYLSRESGGGQQWCVAVADGEHTCDCDSQPSTKQFEYVVTVDHESRLVVHRHGEFWNDITGSALFKAMVTAIVTAIVEQDRIIRDAVACLVCATIAHADEVLRNTYDILEGGFEGESNG